MIREADSPALHWPVPARWRLDQWMARTGFNADSTKSGIARRPPKARVADSLQASTADLIGIDDARPIEPEVR